MADFDETETLNGSVHVAAHGLPDFQAVGQLARTQGVKKRRPIYLPGDLGDAVYLVKTGRVKISTCAQTGKEFTFAILKPGEIFGEVEALDGSPRRTSAEALDDVILGVIPRESFLRYLQENPDLTLALTRHLGARLQRLQSRVEDLVFKDVPARLVHLLQEVGETTRTADGAIRAKMTHQEMANLIGCNRETVSMILGQLRERGLIRLDRCSITILNRDRFSGAVA